MIVNFILIYQYIIVHIPTLMHSQVQFSATVPAKIHTSASEDFHLHFFLKFKEDVGTLLKEAQHNNILKLIFNTK